MSDERDPNDPRPLGERPGANGSPWAPSWQDAPGRTPRSVLSVVLSTAPFLVLAVVVALVAGR